MIFNYFFDDYKRRVLENSRKRLKWYELILLLSYILSSISMIVIFPLNIKVWIKSIPCVLLTVTIVVLILYTKMRDKKERELKYKHYFDHKINGLMQLLNDEKYNLLSSEGIDWLISRCNEKLSTNYPIRMFKVFKEFFSSVIFPVITLTLGYALRDLDISKLLSYAILVVLTIIMLFGVFLVVKPIITTLLFFDKEKYERLCLDLQYIKTQLKLDIN